MPTPAGKQGWDPHILDSVYPKVVLGKKNPKVEVNDWEQLLARGLRLGLKGSLAQVTLVWPQLQGTRTARTGQRVCRCKRLNS